MSERNHSYPDWDDSVYGTGPTDPPKNRGTLVALLLILIIFLCGIATVLGLLNIRLFQELKTDHEKKELGITFTMEPTEESDEMLDQSVQVEEPSIPSSTAVTSMNLQTAPKGIDNIP